MRIIAIDPGSTQSAWVFIKDGRIERAEIWPNEALLGGSYNDSHLPFKVDAFCIEWITSYGMRVGAEVFDTCRFVGQLQERYKGERPILVKRMDVKLWHCGKPSAKDADITGALKEKYGEKGTKDNPGYTHLLKKDLWQAFGLAAYWMEKNKAA